MVRVFLTTWIVGWGAFLIVASALECFFVGNEPTGMAVFPFAFEILDDIPPMTKLSVGGIFLVASIINMMLLRNRWVVISVALLACLLVVVIARYNIGPLGYLSQFNIIALLGASLVGSLFLSKPLMGSVHEERAN